MHQHTPLVDSSFCCSTYQVPVGSFVSLHSCHYLRQNYRYSQRKQSFRIILELNLLEPGFTRAKRHPLGLVAPTKLLTSRAHSRNSCRLQTFEPALYFPQGEIIQDNGNMTGGGGRPIRGLMRLGNNAPPPTADQETLKREAREAESQHNALTQVGSYGMTEVVHVRVCCRYCWRSHCA